MKKNVCTLLVISAVILTSCAPTYVPNVRNVALFRRAGEFQGSVHFGQGIDAQGAVSITNHIGLMGNYENVNRNTNDFNDVDKDKYLKHNFYEGAIGYYQNEGKLAYEFFGGYGRGEGTSYNYYSLFQGDVRAQGKYSRIFIQPSVGSNSHIFNWMVSMRMSHVDFDELTNVDPDSPTLGKSFDPEPVLFLEPAFTGRGVFG
jgi:hypothetical protein